MEDKKYMLLVQAKNIFEELKTDEKNVLFTEDKINDRIFKKIKISKYVKDKELVNLVNNVEDLKAINKTVSKIILLQLNYVKKREIDRSTLHSLDRPFQLVHADVANLKFLGKSATHPKYCQLIVDVFSTKIYIYLVRSQKHLAKKLQKFDTKVSKKKIINKQQPKDESSGRSRISTKQNQTAK